MIQQETHLTLRIEADAQRGIWRINVTLDGHALGEQIELEERRITVVRDIVDGYRQHLKQPGSPEMAADALAAVGIELFNVALSGVWEQILATRDKRPLMIFIAALDPEILHLPWEFLRPPKMPPLCLAEGVWIRRLATSGGEPKRCCPVLPPPPLRILVVPLLPDGPALDWVEERRAIAATADSAKRPAVIGVAPSGRFEEICASAQAFQPQLVHLIGPVLVREKRGFLAFEEGDSSPDLRSGEEIAKAFLEGSGTQCIIISGIGDHGAPPLAATSLLCAEITASGLPMALSWPRPGRQLAESSLTTELIARLAEGERMDVALSIARQRLLDNDGDPAWGLPLLYAGSQQGLLFNITPSVPTVPPNATPRPKLERISALSPAIPRRWLDRLEEENRLLGLLRSDQNRIMLLTGPAGCGKSVMATRLALRMADAEMLVVGLSSQPGLPLSAPRLLQAFAETCRQAGMDDEHQLLLNGDIDIGDRLRLVIELMNRRATFLLVLDGLEQDIDSETGDLQDPLFAAVVKMLVQHLAGASRLLITSRVAIYPHEGKAVSSIRVETLAPIRSDAFVLSLMENRQLAERITMGALHLDRVGPIKALVQSAPALMGMAERYLLGTSSDALDPIQTDELIAHGAESLSDEASEALQICAAAGTSLPWNRLVKLTGTTVASLDALREAGWLFDHDASGDLDASAGVQLPSPLGSLFMAHEGLSDQAQSELHRQVAMVLMQEVQAPHGPATALQAQNSLERLYQTRHHFLLAGDNEGALQASQPLNGILMAGGFLHDLRRVNQALLDQGVEHPSVMNWIALSHLHAGEPEPAQIWFQRSVDLLGDRMTEEAAMAWHGLATAEMEKRQLSSALKKLARVATIQEHLSHPEETANTRHQIAAILMEQNRLADAREELDKALALDRKVKNRRGESATLHQLGTLDMREGKRDAALESFQQAESIDREINNPLGLANVMPWIGNILFTRGELGGAKKAFEESLKLRKLFPDMGSEAFIRHQLGTIEVNQQDHDAALEHYRASLKLKQELRDHKGQAATFFQLARMAKENNKLEQALKLVGIAHRIDQEFGIDDAKQEWEIVEEIAEALELDEAALNGMLEEAWEQFRQDQGWGLLDKTFKKRKIIPIIAQ
ncbi:MAG: tetratricopeptide repeat protein [Magnetococcales bacterium]|nr:tetratricopeptide repeat protein [Magnetococcales bacterium]